MWLLLGRLLVAGCWITALANGLNWGCLVLLGAQLFLLPYICTPGRPSELSSSTEELRRAMPDSKGGAVPGPSCSTRILEAEEAEREGAAEGEDNDDGGDNDDDDDEGLSLLALRDFYGSQLCREGAEAPRELCDLVHGLLESLLHRIQAFGPCCRAVLNQRCRGVGSMFEGWGTNRGQQIPVYDLLVIFSAPAGLRLEVELQFGQKGSTDETPDDPLPPAPPSKLQGTASVHVRADPERASARLFSSRSRLEDFVTRVQSERIKEGLDYLLEECFMIGQQMEPQRVLAWLGGALRKAWRCRRGAKLSFWGQENPCLMRLQSAAGRVLYISVVPAVRLPDSDLCVVARTGWGAGTADPSGCGRWETWFCSDEEFYLRRVARSLPSASCHTVCLEILAYLNRPPLPLSRRVASFLSSYHLKTALLHLLHAHTHTHTHTHTHPHLWDGPCLMERLDELLLLLEKGVSERTLLSFWVGNPALGELGPALLRSAAPLNLFWALEHAGWAELAQQELRRLRVRLQRLPTTRAALSRLAPHEPNRADREEARSSTFGWKAGLIQQGLDAYRLGAVTHAKTHALRAVTQKLNRASVGLHKGAPFGQASHTHTLQ